MWIYLYPNNTETALSNAYIHQPTTPITTAWIYRSSDLWVISFQTSNWVWISIADKDLWATTVLGKGNGYQRWNNYWWIYWTSAWNTSSTLVDASAYWPWNYYSSDTFILTTANWDSPVNNNLRWATTDTYVARRWPCPEWWHIPSLSDCQDLVNAISSITGSVDGSKIVEYAKLPDAYGMSSTNWAWMASWFYWILMSDVIEVSGVYKARLLYIPESKTSYNINEHYRKSNWWQYRPFSNTFIQPTNDWTQLN